MGFKHDCDSVEEAEEMLAKEITDIGNIMGTNFGTALADELKRTHRTIQQVVVKELIKAIVSLAELNSDMRNEDAVEAAKKIKELDLYFRYI
jgi:hypothetical protein